MVCQAFAWQWVRIIIRRCTLETLTGFCLLVGIHQMALEPKVQELGHKEWQVREQAHKWLAKQLKVPWEEFLVAGLRKNRDDPEIACRIRHLTAKWDSFMTVYGKYPWLCALPKGYPDKDKIFQEYFSRACYGEDFAQYRQATYLWLCDLRAQGYWISSLKAIQEMMIPNERFWYQHNRYPE